MKIKDFAAFFLLSILAFGSCSKDVVTPGDNGSDETQTPVVQKKKNRIIENGVESKIRTTFVSFQSNRLCFVVSSDKMAGLDEFSDHDSYTVSVLPTLLGETFDLKSETTTYSIARFSASDGRYNIYVTPHDLEQTKSGNCRVVLNEQEHYAVLDFSLTQEDGTQVSVYDSLACDLVIPASSKKNYYWSKVGGVESKKPINAAFYQKTDNGFVNIYLTPGAIDYFDELDATTSYVCLSVLDRKMPVGEQDITTTPTPFVLLYRTQEGDYIQSPLLVQIFNDYSFGYSGSFSVAKGEEEGEYALSIKIAGEVELDINFSGVCKSSELKRQIPNEYVYKGKASPINSVIVDKNGSETVNVWLSSEQGLTSLEDIKNSDPICISGFPKSQIGTSGNELPCGFSVYESLQVKYGTKSWSYASGDAGTVILTDLGTDNYYVKFTNYAGFSLEWQGLSTTL